MNAATDRPAPWYRPGIADVIFLLASLAAVRGAQHSLLDDPGLGWHLRNIDAIVQQGGWLTVDLFTEPRDGPPWQHAGLRDRLSSGAACTRGLLSPRWRAA